MWDHINWPVVILIIFLVLVLLVVASCIKIVPQAKGFRDRAAGRLQGDVGDGPAFQDPVY